MYTKPLITILGESFSSHLEWLQQLDFSLFMRCFVGWIQSFCCSFDMPHILLHSIRKRVLLPNIIYKCIQFHSRLWPHLSSQVLRDTGMILSDCALVLWHALVNYFIEPWGAEHRYHTKTSFNLLLMCVCVFFFPPELQLLSLSPC